MTGFLVQAVLVLLTVKCEQLFAFHTLPQLFSHRKRSSFNTNGQSQCLKASVILSLAGKGMGMGMAATKKKGGKKQSKSPPFNVNASLLRLEKRYDELMLEAAKTMQKDVEDDDDDVTTEYVVAARADGYIGDWVPIAQFCLSRNARLAANSDGVSDPLISATVSQYCRELSHVASLGSRVFQSVPRNLLQYSVETADSFHKHVHEPMQSGKAEDSKDSQSMTKNEARKVLSLPETINGSLDDRAEIKRSYRKQSFEWHPDRFAGQDRSEADVESASEHYSRIKLAYDTLTSGVRNEQGKSWYQSLGGRARTDFIGPLTLLSLSEAKKVLDSCKVKTAVVGLDPELVQSFVARSQQ